MSIKLPKQWRHWVKSTGLQIGGIKKSKWARRPHSWFYLVGRGYVWRVNCHGKFQRGDRLKDFDKWALCEIDEVDIPKTKDQFMRAVDQLVAQSGGNKA